MAQPAEGAPRRESISKWQKVELQNKVAKLRREFIVWFAPGLGVLAVGILDAFTGKHSKIITGGELAFAGLLLLSAVFAWYPYWKERKLLKSLEPSTRNSKKHVF